MSIPDRLSALNEIRSEAARTIGRSTAQLHRRYPGMGMTRSDAARMSNLTQHLNHYRRIDARL